MALSGYNFPVFNNHIALFVFTCPNCAGDKHKKGFVTFPKRVIIPSSLILPAEHFPNSGCYHSTSTVQFYCIALVSTLMSIDEVYHSDTF